jgi:hypothetical protein
VTWWLEWGKHVPGMRELAASGRPVPALQRAPREQPELDLFVHCYVDVSGDRAFNGAITFGAVARWCEAYGAAVPEVWPVVKVADDEVRRWHESRR